MNNIAQILLWFYNSLSGFRFSELRYIALIIAVLIFVPQASNAGSLEESQVKTAYLYNFLRFVKWPPPPKGNPAQPTTICILGKDSFGGALDMLEKETSSNQPIIIKHNITLQDSRSCTVLYISNSQEDNLPTIFSAIKGLPILTVGETEGFASQGGMVGFVSVEGSIKLAINVTAATKAGLVIDVMLLEVAQKIIR